MPESRLRKKSTFTAPAPKSNTLKPSPRWFAALMVGLLIAGLAWVVAYYITQGEYPIPGIGDFNLLVGFGVLLTGFGMLTRWR
jgi:Cell division protein CrgA